MSTSDADERDEWEHFLQATVSTEQRADRGLEALFRRSFPLRCGRCKRELQFRSYDIQDGWVLATFYLIIYSDVLRGLDGKIMIDERSEERRVGKEGE